MLSQSSKPPRPTPALASALHSHCHTPHLAPAARTAEPPLPPALPLCTPTCLPPSPLPSPSPFSDPSRTPILSPTVASSAAKLSSIMGLKIKNDCWSNQVASLATTAISRSKQHAKLLLQQTKRQKSTPSDFIISPPTTHLHGFQKRKTYNYCNSYLMRE